MQNENSIAKKLLQNKLLVALVISIAIVATLFYSTPALAFHAGNSPSVSYVPGQTNLTVTVQIIKDHADEILLSPSNITASLLYTNGYMADQIPATNCTFERLTYGNVSGYMYGFDFYGYGYGHGATIIRAYSNVSGYNWYSGYDYGYGYGNYSDSSLYCTFHFNSTYVLNKITVGITTYVNGYNLLNSSTYSSSTATSSIIFTQVIAIQQANGTTSANGTVFTANETSTVTFNTQDGATPMKVVMPSGTVMTLLDNSSTAGVISIGVVPPENKPSALSTSRTMGPVLELGPAGATFSPAINISFNMSYVKNQSGKTIATLYALYTAGYLQIRKVTDAGVTTDLNTTWVGGTSESCSDCLLVTQVSSFSDFGTYDSTPSTPSPSGGSSSGTGGGSISRPYVAPETTNDSVTPTTPETTPTTTPVPKQKAVISAPSSITAGETVVLTLTDQYGAPISSATIIVSDPNGNKLEYVTDANGYARFVALVSGTYTYAVRNIELASAPSTTVIAKPKAQTTATTEQTAQEAAEQAASSPLLGGALFLVGAGAIVLIVLVAVVYLLFFKKGGKKGL